MEATVSTILARKGYRVTTVSLKSDLAAVARLLTDHRIGACPVVDSGGRLVGMISERDIVRAIASSGAAALELRAEEAMSREVRTCGPGEQAGRLAEVMTSQRFRHLPVVRDGDLVGIVSIGDIVKQRLDEAQAEVEALRTYIAS